MPCVPEDGHRPETLSLPFEIVYSTKMSPSPAGKLVLVVLDVDLIEQHAKLGVPHRAVQPVVVLVHAECASGRQRLARVAIEIVVAVRPVSFAHLEAE